MRRSGVWQSHHFRPSEKHDDITLPDTMAETMHTLSQAYERKSAHDLTQRWIAKVYMLGRGHSSSYKRAHWPPFTRCVDTGADEAKVAENGRIISCHMLAPRTPLPCVHTACGRSTCLCGVSAESDWVTIAEAHRDQAAGTTSLRMIY